MKCQSNLKKYTEEKQKWHIEMQIFDFAQYKSDNFIGGDLKLQFQCYIFFIIYFVRNITNVHKLKKINQYQIT